MQIRDICEHLETIAPLPLQEDYDNSGLIVGRPNADVQSVLVSLDCLEATIYEAVDRNCQMVVCHHPIVFGGIKKFNGKNYVERTVEMAIKHNVAIYAIHTNLDNVLQNGVNQQIAKRIGLKGLKILSPKKGGLLKLATYVPKDDATPLLNALFAAGAGRIGNYTACSFATSGFGTFKGNENSNPAVGEKGVQHTEGEQKIEVVLKAHEQSEIYSALIAAHPYEEVAYEFYPTTNHDPDIGSGIIGELDKDMDPSSFLQHLKKSMQLEVIKHTPFKRNISKVAICGGSGSFLLSSAKALNADAFITADVKYHQFFDAENTLMYCDIGHYESEKFTIDLLHDILTENFPTFAVLKTEGDTNPIKYFH